jgi:hypothetical protein
MMNEMDDTPHIPNAYVEKLQVSSRPGVTPQSLLSLVGQREKRC